MNKKVTKHASYKVIHKIINKNTDTINIKDNRKIKEITYEQLFKEFKATQH